MSAEFARKVFALVESTVHRRIAPAEFELAYQARVAIDRIRFAIGATEHAAHQPDLLREAGFQLLDALGRLESAERNFQKRFSSICLNGGSEGTDHHTTDPNGEPDLRKQGSSA